MLIFKKLIFLFLFIFLLLQNTDVYAQDNIFYDDFSDIAYTNSIWMPETGTWPHWGTLASVWSIESGAYTTTLKRTNVGSVVTSRSPLWGNYTISADLFSYDGIDQYLLFRFKDSQNFYGLDLRAEWNYAGDLNGNVILFKWVNGVQTLVYDSINHPPQYYIYHNKWYHVDINVVNESIGISIYDKDNPTNRYEINEELTDIYKGKIGLATLGGDYLILNPGSISKKAFDNVKVIIYDTNPTISPSPSPPPTAGNVVLLVPGHGASLNLTDLLTNVHQGEWKRMPYFYTEVYGPLIDSFRNAGYSFDNNKFYEFTYDWTRPVDEISDNLKNYINNTIMPENHNKKIDIVAHSLGGLVSRNWLQKNSDAPSKLNKLITVGSPHEGVVDTYAAWEGGEVWRDDPIQKFAFELPLYIFKQKYISKTQALREIAPSTGDLLPIFDYLKYRDGTSIKYDNLLDAKNDFLTDLRSNLNNNSYLKNLINIYRGNNFDTLDSLVIKERTKAEEALDQWMDGRPVQKEYTKSGDGTVLSKSSNIDNKDFKEVNLNHVDLIKTSDGIKNIFNILGIPNQYINTNFKTEENQKYLAFVTNPPICVTVTDDLGKKLGCDANNQLITENRISSGDSDESGGLIIINNPTGQTYSLEAKPKGLEKTELIKIEMENQNIHFKKYPFSLNSNNNFFFIKDKNASYDLSKNGEVINISAKYDNLYNSVYSDLSTTSYKQIFLSKLFEEKENLQKINQYISLGWNKKAGEEILKSQSEIIKLIKVAQKMFADNESDFFLIKQEILDIVSDLKDLYLTLPLELKPHEVEVNLASLDNRLKYLENKFDQKENYKELKDTAWDLQYINNLLSEAYNFWSVSDYQSANIYSYLGDKISREIDLK